MKSIDELFEKPERSERPLRVLVVGGPKTGKSHFVFTATKVGPLYWQDSEGGADLYPDDKDHGFQVLLSRDPRKTIEAIQAANQMVKPGKPRPVIAVDSMSSVWFQQQQVHDQLVGKFGRFGAWAPAKKPLRELYELMHSTRCHVIITARAKEDWEVDASGKPLGHSTIPDAERGLPYAMDLILMLSKDIPEDGRSLTPQDFWARVIGTRSPSVDGEQPPIPTGLVFRDPKFSDLLDAVVEGRPPSQIEDTTGAQVTQELGKPRSFKELVSRVEEKGWTEETAKTELADKFGKWDRTRLGEYLKHLEQTTPPSAAEKGKKKNGSKS